jgi:molybdopterin converting factor small subunit
VKPALIRIELSDALTDSQYPLDEVRSLIDKLSSEHELLQPIEKDYSLFKERVDEQQAHIERLLDQGSFEGLQGAKAQMGILERAIKEGDFDRTQIDKLNERIDEQQTFFDMWVKRPAKPSWEELSKYARQALVTGVNIFRLIGNSNETEQITGNPLTQLLEPLLQSEEDIQNRVAELRRRIESARQDVEAEKGKVVSELKEQLAQLKDKFEKAHTQSQTWLDTSLRLGGTLEIADWQTIQRLDDHLNNHQPLTLDLLRELSDIESKATSSIVLTICQLLRTRHTELQASSQSEPQELQKVVEAALQTQREQDLYTDLSKIQGLISEWEGIYLSPTATPEEVSDMADVLHTLNTYKEAAKNSKSRWIYNKIIAELKKLFERRIPTPKRKQFKEILSIDDFETGEEIVQQPQPPQKPVASPKQPIQKPPTIQSANKNKERKS